MSFGSRLKHAWNAFSKVNDDDHMMWGQPASYSVRPDRARFRYTNEKSIISSIYTRIAVDVASVSIRHVRTDTSGRYLHDEPSSLNECLTIEANVDQGARAFRQDIAMTLFDDGVAAIVPVETDLDPSVSNSYEIRKLRVGRVRNWFPKHVKLSVYNEDKGEREDVVLEKKYVGVVENPLYAIMNEPNSTLQRLITKLNFLDIIDRQSSSGKLDLIIQLPYVVKSETRRQQADQRRKDIENQLTGSQYGIAYTDGTEKITQLNRPVENNLLKQIEMLVKMLYAQLGLTEEVMNGSAGEATMLNYMNRTVEPIVDAMVEAMRRSFLTKTARTQGQSIMAFRDPFRLVPVGQVAEIADKFSRNEILSANEIRQAIGFAPSKDPKADQLVNSNMPQGTNPAVRVPSTRLLNPDNSELEPVSDRV
jgi:hypothetical protein